MSLFKQANEDLRQKRYEAAISNYVHALQQPDALPQLIQGNLKLAQDRYLKSRQEAKPCVCISGWNLAQNAADRVATLALLYQPLAEVNIIGCYFKKWGFETWAPLRNFPIPIHGIQVKDECQFIDQALELVLQHPCDLLHLSKPRFPNILIGALYKLIWNAHVVIDIDDEELAFANATEPLPLDAWLKTVPNPKLDDLTGASFTRLAVGLAKTFDGITVVNPALQKRYGGELVRQARDDKHFSTRSQRRQASRAKHGIAASEKVVLFLGTPHQHKGLLETAHAIASLKRQDVLFFIVGDFLAPLHNVKIELQAIPGLKTRFLGDQPFETIHDILALGDLCILLRDPDQLAAQYQTPAKLTDALAMGIPVLAESTPGLEDLAAKNAFTVVTRATLAAAIDTAFFKQPATDPQPHPAYRELFTLAANQQPLQHILTSAEQRTAATALAPALRTLLNHLPLGPGLVQLSTPLSTAATARPTQYAPALTALPAPSSISLIDLPKLSSDAVIQKAADAMQQDDWAGAYECWKSLLTRPKDTLTTSLLLRISRELFKLDAFTDAAIALNQAAAKDPNHPGVLGEQAAQYYYHCYSSWLMLVTENEPDWYKADGLEKRPDWQTACNLIEKAEKAAPRNNLRRYVQAYLLLAEEARDKQQRTEAHAALRTALNAIGPNKLDKVLTASIFQAIDGFRDGKIDEKDPCHQSLQDQLKALPLELLPVPDWLCLNDILNWNGLLLCGYVAREKAVDLALEQGKANPKNKDLLKTALKAALDRNDTVQADDFFVKLKQISPDTLDVRELDSCCELMKGNLEAFRKKWPYPSTPSDKHFREYLKGKTVAVVGPAVSTEDHSADIKNYDVQVRINWRNRGRDMALNLEHAKVDVTLYNAHSARLLLTKSSSSDWLPGVEYCLVRRSRNELKFALNSQSVIRRISEYPGSICKSLNAIPAVVFDLLLNGATKVKVFGTDFYSGKKYHHAGYRNSVTSDDKSLLRCLQPVVTNHDLISQIKLMEVLARTSSIDLDAKSAEIALEWSIKRYLSTLFDNLVSEFHGASDRDNKIEKYDKTLKGQVYSSHLETSRPVALLLNGPSAAKYGIGDISENAIFARCNFFHKEEYPRYGREVDFYFWSVNNPILNSDIADMISHNSYHLHNLCCCVSAFQLEFSRENINPLSLLNRQICDHWKVIMRNVELGRYLSSRPLPTTGVQAIAFFAVLGFKRFEIIGMDFYQGNERYMYNPSAEMKEKMDKKHFTPGYEKGAHTLDLDVSFLIEILRQYPDIEIKNIANNQILKKIASGVYPKRVAYDNLPGVE